MSSSLLGSCARAPSAHDHTESNARSLALGNMAQARTRCELQLARLAAIEQIGGGGAQTQCGARKFAPDQMAIRPSGVVVIFSLLIWLRGY